MSTTLIVSVIIAYFLVLVLVAYLTSRKANNDAFFLGERKSPWYLVSFGMIGASLSGVTFISIPGWVGDAGNQFSYMQAVLGYFVGYFIVTFVLLPLFYRMKVTSIYEYLGGRYGNISYKTGASFFLLSRVIGASVRLLLVANVLQEILFKAWGVPFEVTVVISVALIWAYTNRGGIKTIVWTDTLQTTFMLLSVILTVWFISDQLNLSDQGGTVTAIADSSFSKIFFFDDINSSNHFFKHFLGGIFITIGMTGLDQDMMQKNLSCKNTKDAQKNMISMASILVVVNLVFLGLGALLYMYVQAHPDITYESSDLLFSAVAMSDGAGPVIGLLFLLGLIAAAYSSADSALTSLTTSVSVDFLKLQEKEEQEQLRTRKKVHVIMSLVLVIVVILLKYGTNESAIGLLMKFAGFTYGPLIAMFFFGIMCKRKVKDGNVVIACVIGMVLTILAWLFSHGSPIMGDAAGIFGMYKFGFELIILNSVLSFLALWLLSGSSKTDSTIIDAD